MKKILGFGLAGVLIWSCGTPPENTSEMQVAATPATAPVSETEDIALNNGRKWQVKADMSPHILKGEALVDAYVQQNQTDYKKLAQEVDAQNSQLIDNCSMEGASHDALHKWLQPHLELVDQLGKETDPEKAQQTALQLQRSYQQYHQYFQ